MSLSHSVDSSKQVPTGIHELGTAVVVVEVVVVEVVVVVDVVVGPGTRLVVVLPVPESPGGSAGHPVAATASAATTTATRIRPISQPPGQSNERTLPRAEFLRRVDSPRAVGCHNDAVQSAGAGGLRPNQRRLLTASLALSGAAALVLQVSWQRVIALHAGVDLSSSTTVVAAFLAGMGLGNLLGGRVADRLSPQRSGRLLGICISAVGVLALGSTSSFNALYSSSAEHLDSALVTFLFSATLLLIPTTLMGATLPLVARATTDRADRAAPLLGRLNAANTFGAAIGAIVALFLAGEIGFVGATVIAGGLNLVAGALTLALFSNWASDRWARSHNDSTAVDAPNDDRTGPEAERPEGTTPGPAVAHAPVAIWFVVYGLTGAVALGLEQVYFRLIDGIMRSNAYTFGFVLAVYLTLWSAGSAIGSRLVTRTTRHRTALLWLLFGVGVAALGMLTVFVQVLPAIGFGGRFDVWFNSDGFAAGLGESTPLNRLLFGIGLPVLMMAPPVVLLGAAFPFAQAVVTDQLESVGRTTGRLGFANLVGNVVGALVTGFVLIDRLGTTGTFVALTIPLLAAGIVAALRTPSVTRRTARLSAVGAVIALLALWTPSNSDLWATLLGTKPDAMLLAEDRSCASAIELYGDGNAQLNLNGASQNGYPFDDFHILIGLLPALAMPDPDTALAVGLGIGSTSYGLLSSDRVESVTTVELCGGNYDLIRELGRRDATHLERLGADPRHRPLVGDGRKHLLVSEQTYDLIVPDTMRTTSAGSGSLYSREYFELMSRQLSDDGLVAIWQASNRVLNAASTTFPHVVSIEVASYSNSRFLLASRSPIELDTATLLERFDEIPEDAFDPGQRFTLRLLLENLPVECINDGALATDPLPHTENRDMHPRDEYFLSNDGVGDDGVVRTCKEP